MQIRMRNRRLRGWYENPLFFICHNALLRIMHIMSFLKLKYRQTQLLNVKWKYYREQHDLMRTNQHNLNFILKYYREQLAFFKIPSRTITIFLNTIRNSKLISFYNALILTYRMVYNVKKVSSFCARDLIGILCVVV